MEAAHLSQNRDGLALTLLGEFLNPFLWLSWWEVLLEHASSASTAPRKEVTTRAVSLGLARSWLA